MYVGLLADVVSLYSVLKLNERSTYIPGSLYYCVVDQLRQ